MKSTSVLVGPCSDWLRIAAITSMLAVPGLVALIAAFAARRRRQERSRQRAVVPRRCGALVLAAAAILVTGCGGGGGSRPEGVDNPAQVGAMRDLEQSSSDPVEIRFDGNVPRFARFRIPIEGTLPDDPVVQTLDFLERFNALYGLDDPRSQLYLQRVRTGPDGVRHVFYHQKIGDIPVFASGVAVHLSDDQYLAASARHLPAVIDAARPPVEDVWPERPSRRLSHEDRDITAADAEMLALQDFDGSDAEVSGEPVLVYYDGGLIGEPDIGIRLAWKLHIQGIGQETGRPSSWLYIVDARTGDILLGYDEYPRHAPNKKYNIRTANNADITCGTNSSADVQWFDENGVLSGVSPDADGQDAFDFIDQTYDYYQSTFDYHGWDGNDNKTIRVLVHVDSGWTNASSWSRGCLIFGDGMVTRDIVAHEFTHSIDRHTASLRYKNQSGALDESYADIAGALVDFDDWWIWEGNTGLGNRCGSTAPAGTRRSLADPTLCGHPAHVRDFLETDTDNGGVHTNSSIHNKAAYLIAAGGTHEGVAVNGMGRDKMGRLMFRAHTEWLGRNADFFDARDAAITQAWWWSTLGRNGFTAEDVCDVRNAYSAVGLGLPDRDCDGLDDAADTDDDGDYTPDGEDNCPRIANPGQGDVDDDGTGDACDEDADSDGLNNDNDNCPLVANESQLDFDDDGIGDRCDDSDGDGALDSVDNCLTTFNPRQTNSDTGLAGDACDTDDDDDDVPDEEDNCPTTFNFSQDDGDGDGVGDACDNCPAEENPEQADTDGDSSGNVCDADDDGDGLDDATDNCRTRSNPHQIDIDGNGIGLRCDATEVGMLDGNFAGVLDGTIRFEDPSDTIRIPVTPCIADGCPDSGWIPEGFRGTVAIATGEDLPVRLVNNRGHLIDTGRTETDSQGQITGHAAGFGVRGDYQYTAPGTQDTFSDRSYFLELGAPAGSQGPTDVNLSIGVGNSGPGSSP